MSKKIDVFLPLHPAAFQILLSLAAGERHGYALKREIAARSAGKLTLGPAMLYGSLQKLIEQNLIEESPHRPEAHLDDERRRYYRITSLGRRVTAAETERLRGLVRFADAALREA